MQLTLYIDTSSNRLLTSLNTSSPVNPLALPLFVGDTLQLQVYLMTPLQTFTPSVPNYEIVPTVGLSLELYITNGLNSSAAGYDQYTQQVVWNTDPNNQYFYASLALNTLALVNLLGTNTSAKAYLVIGYLLGGVDTTVLYQQVNIQPGTPTADLVVPPGLTPLSLEVASGIFVPKSGVPPNAPAAFGGSITLTTPLGKKLILSAADDGAGGAIAEWSNSN